MDGRRPSVSSLRGIVAAGHPQAAQAGAAILRAGGNAFDAAAATAAALNVAEPYMSGLAGMGMATCYIAAERRVRTLDFITRVPSEFPAGRFTSREQLARPSTQVWAAECGSATSRNHDGLKKAIGGRLKIYGAGLLQLGVTHLRTEANPDPAA